jgi:hypothetical protein
MPLYPLTPGDPRRRRVTEAQAKMLAVIAGKMAAKKKKATPVSD